MVMKHKQWIRGNSWLDSTDRKKQTEETRGRFGSYKTKDRLQVTLGINTAFSLEPYMRHKSDCLEFSTIRQYDPYRPQKTASATVQHRWLYLIY